MSEVSLIPSVCKVRLRFSKTGDMRFLSHHDLMRLLERLLRRASLPFRSTEGFNPKAKITFASALSLGIIGHEEVVEIELDGDHSAESVIEVLSPLVPEGFRFLSGRSDFSGTCRLDNTCRRSLRNATPNPETRPNWLNVSRIAA